MVEVHRKRRRRERREGGQGVGRKQKKKTLQWIIKINRQTSLIGEDGDTDENPKRGIEIKNLNKKRVLNNKELGSSIILSYFNVEHQKVIKTPSFGLYPKSL